MRYPKVKPRRRFEPGMGSTVNVWGLSYSLRVPHQYRAQAEMFRASIRVLKRKWGKKWWGFVR